MLPAVLFVFFQLLRRFDHDFFLDRMGADLSTTSVIDIIFVLNLLGITNGSLTQYKQFTYQGLPIKLNHVPREIPAQSHSSLISLLLFSTLLPVIPFALCHGSLRETSRYEITDMLLNLLVYLVMLLMICEQAVVLTFYQLCREDYRWWWVTYLQGALPMVFCAAVYLWAQPIVTFGIFVWALMLGVVFGMGGGALAVQVGYTFLTIIFRKEKIS